MSLPDSTAAVGLSGPGGPEVLVAQTRPIPAPGPNQVLIRVDYAGVNRHDCGQRIRGTPPAGATDILGLEVAGETAACGAGVRGREVGDRVCALANGGGYAQSCLAEAPVVLPLPLRFDAKEAAMLPEALFTVWLSLRARPAARRRMAAGARRHERRGIDRDPRRARIRRSRHRNCRVGREGGAVCGVRCERRLQLQDIRLLLQVR